MEKNPHFVMTLLWIPILLLWFFKMFLISRMCNKIFWSPTSETIPLQPTLLLKNHYFNSKFLPKNWRFSLQIRNATISFCFYSGNSFYGNQILSLIVFFGKNFEDFSSLNDLLFEQLKSKQQIVVIQLGYWLQQVN